MFNICLVYLFHPFIFNLSLSLCLGALSRLLLIFKKFVHFGFICHLVWWLCLLIGEFNHLWISLLICLYLFLVYCLVLFAIGFACLFACMLLPHTPFLLCLLLAGSNLVLFLFFFTSSEVIHSISNILMFILKTLAFILYVKSRVSFSTIFLIKEKNLICLIPYIKINSE